LVREPCPSPAVPSRGNRASRMQFLAGPHPRQRWRRRDDCRVTRPARRASTVAVRVTQVSWKRHRSATGEPYPLNGLTIVDKLLEFVLMLLAQGVAQFVMAPRAARRDTTAACACATHHPVEARVDRSAVDAARRGPIAQRRRAAPRRRSQGTRPVPGSLDSALRLPRRA
jgi:hypothetical protein